MVKHRSTRPVYRHIPFLHLTIQHIERGKQDAGAAAAFV